jgi:CheY-like chemotaxis protein/PAS domain-containing protein
LSTKPKILCLSDTSTQDDNVLRDLGEQFDLVQEQSLIRALVRLSREEFAGLYLASDHLQDALDLGRSLQNERILEGMPDGVALVDNNNDIVWANEQLTHWCQTDELANRNFYAALGSPEILGPDFCPFHTVLATGEPSNSTLKCKDLVYFQIHAAPVLDGEGPPQHLIATVRDVTSEVLQQQKLAAIHKAGIELADLTPEEVFEMHVEDRIELLKSNILHYTQDLLNFNVVEIRMLVEATSRLEPLLSVGLAEEAAVRPLYAQPQNNGVTGFVAATGKSYLCEDTLEDPLYLEGFKGAKSSLTVPLILHDQVIGTFNVESPEPRSFTESDLQFLEIFSRDVAAALNTLELLVAQKANTALESVDAIHSAVAMPVDEILNDAVNVMERYIGHEPEVTERLQRILRNARDIKQVIHNVGQKMTPAEALPSSAKPQPRPALKHRRILVVDADESVRSAAHDLLERYDCVVETAHEGGEAVYMVRSGSHEIGYDVIIADIRLPDMSGYELLIKLKGVMPQVPLVLMSGFGYDPGHSIVKARQAGLNSSAVLYKPFRLDQLLETVEATLKAQSEVPQA